MSSARLTALRLVGFKSFAERTTVEFGPGISAVVGPNGSGKSNLADALRWTLGEQGRSLRTRRSEDVIFAGSSSRRAVGMADVTLVIDNHDRLLPVDFGEVEVGRRLYRSGENEYLLNRQRIRLRELVELLDAGNLADNAFLFIGQGMVDQALALRPEERRPLFEEAAGVRRHERRRRQAEGELAEAETNLERLRDLLGELRPQARRLAAQAEQLQARQSAGVELADALLTAARVRWVASATEAAREQKQLERARAAADAALSALNEAEARAATLSAQIGKRAAEERSRRAALDEQRSRLTELRVAQARFETETAALTRDAQRLSDERAAAEERLRRARAVLSGPVVTVDPSSTDELERVSRELVEAEAAVGSGSARTTDEARRELAARRTELAQRVAQADALARTARDAQARLADLGTRAAAADNERAAAADAALGAAGQESEARAALDAARETVDRANAAQEVARSTLRDLEAELAVARGRIAAVDAALAAAGDEGLARAARARGAQLVAEGVEIDPRFRRAVSAALGAAATAFLVDEDAVAGFAGRRGALVVDVRAAGRGAAASGAAVAAAYEAAAAAGGGRLADAIRRDPQGAVTRLVERVIWLPTLDAAIAARRSLPAGGRAVTLAGEVVNADGVVELAPAESVLDRRAERDELARDVAQLERRVDEQRAVLGAHASAGAEAAARSRAAREAHDTARAAIRRAEELERAAARRAEQLARELAWERTRVERLDADAQAAAANVARLRDDVAQLERELAADHDSSAPNVALERAAELRKRREQLVRAREERLATARAADDERRRAEITVTLDDARLAELDAEGARLAAREAELASRRERLAAALAEVEAREAEQAASLQALNVAGADQLEQLAAAERTAVEARESLRVAETASRHAEVRAMEARLHLEQTREQLLVELAAIGADGVTALLRAAGEQAHDAEADSIAPEAMEELLERAVERWRQDPTAVDAPSASRLAALRRRFHDLGAGNPFAVEEYAELKERLESLEAQRADMESAIGSTRELIASLSALINDQFRTTFAALEDAFARRFHELFGGGEAQLSLTAPDDLSATGIEIHARPPGKKRQPLAMLSGGERALTAVSLLLAMLEVRPVPFCVLDEVDAALDEANIGRFSRALRGLAEQTQFIVITHNRGTIEGADALYGVTIGDDAVSRVVSLRLPRARGNGDAAHELLAETAAS